MALGSSHAVVASGPQKVYRTIFGSEDFHTHLRWDAVKGWIDPDAERTLEVGAHSGVMTVAVARMVRGSLVSSEFDDASVAVARRVVEHHGLGNVELGQDDLRTLSAGGNFDQALLIDVLEHIDDHETALAQLASALKTGGRLLISVPTPRYPQVFGRAFHEYIGHVRDGYWLGDLQALLDAAGFDVVEHRYYTGRTASRVCSRWYRSVGRAAPMPLLVAMPVLRALARRDERRGIRADQAASLAVLAVRR
jgi:SAM-dependent methyltransferase